MVIFFCNKLRPAVNGGLKEPCGYYGSEVIKSYNDADQQEERGGVTGLGYSRVGPGGVSTQHSCMSSQKPPRLTDERLPRV